MHFRFPLNRWESRPPGIQRVDNHNDRRSPAWHYPIPQSHNRRMCQGDGVLHVKAQSHASDSYARWDEGGGCGRERGGEGGDLRDAAVCVCPITGHNCLRNNHTTDEQAARTHNPAVITGTKPCVKMVLTVQAAGFHVRQTWVYVKKGHLEICLKGK